MNPMVCYTDGPGLLATGTHGADEHPVAIKTDQVTCCRNESAGDSSIRSSSNSRTLFFVADVAAVAAT